MIFSLKNSVVLFIFADFAFVFVLIIPKSINCVKLKPCFVSKVDSFSANSRNVPGRLFTLYGVQGRSHWTLSPFPPVQVPINTNI